MGYLFEGLDGGSPGPKPQQRLLLELSRNFAAIPSRRQQEALCALARVLGGAEEGKEAETAGGGHRPSR